MAINFSTKDAASGTETVSFLEETEALYREAAEQLFKALKSVKRGQIEETKAASNAVRDLRQAIDWVMDERNRVDKLRKQSVGTAGPGALDFAAAADEIGRRLARLRAAGGD